MLPFRRTNTFSSVAILALLAKLWMTSAIRTIAVYAPHDASNFIDRADALGAGRWLGSYDRFTLIKGPLYPMFVALSSALGVPLGLAHQLLYFSACIVACVAVRPVVRDQRVRAALLVFFLFNPYTFGTDAWFSNRSATAESAALLTFACAAGLCARRDAAIRTVAVWSVGLSLSVAAYWLTREDHAWLVPGTMLMLVPVIARAFRAPFARRLVLIAAVVAPALVTLAAEGAVAELNFRAYGWRTVVEAESPEFVAAYASLARIDAGIREPRIPVARPALGVAYRVSVSARELEPILNGPLWDGWLLNSCGAGVCNGMSGGAFQWALRDAVSQAGYYRTGASARAFYLRLAAEIDAACDAHRIACDAKRSTLAPPLLSSELAAFPAAFGEETVGFFGGVSSGSAAFAGWTDSTVAPSIVAEYRRVARDVAPMNSPVEALARSRRDGAKFTVQQAVANAYLDDCEWIAAASTIVLLVRIATAARRRFRNCSAGLTISAGAAVGALTFLVVLSLVDVTSFLTINGEYFAVAYPTALFAIGVVSAMELPVLFGRFSPRFRLAALGALCLTLVFGPLVQARLQNSVAAVEPMSATSATPVAASAPPSFSAKEFARLRPEDGAAPGAVDAVIVSADRTSADVSGWVADPKTKAGPHGIILLVDGRAWADATAQGARDRPDVAKAIATTAEHTGFEHAFVPLAGLSRGRHVLAVGAVSKDDRYRIAPLTYSFEL